MDRIQRCVYIPINDVNFCFKTLLTLLTPSHLNSKAVPFEERNHTKQSIAAVLRLICAHGPLKRVRWKCIIPLITSPEEMTKT